MTLPATLQKVQNIIRQQIVKIAIRTACSEDFAFARNLYFETVRGMVERLFGWDRTREERNFAGVFKVGEVRTIIKVCQSNQGSLAITVQVSDFCYCSENTRLAFLRRSANTTPRLDQFRPRLRMHQNSKKETSPTQLRPLRQALKSKNRLLNNPIHLPQCLETKSSTRNQTQCHTDYHTA
jgi:hypothetical protein